MKQKSFAKINLNLHIHPKREGEAFTPLILVNQQINLFDELEFINQPDRIEVVCYPKNILPKNEDNIVFQAAQKLKDFTQNPHLGVKIILKKNIPFPAGLAGGSSDAATTLKSLKKLWSIKISRQKLLEIASNLGKDVPFFFSSKTCLLTGYGDIPHRLKTKLPKIYLIIVYPNKEQKPSTGWMFQHLDFSKINQNLHKKDLLLKAIEQKNISQIFQNLHNDFETIVFDYFPETKNIVTDLVSSGAIKTLLSGSGLGIIGFFEDNQKTDQAFLKLKQKYSKIFLTNTI